MSSMWKIVMVCVLTGCFADSKTNGADPEPTCRDEIDLISEECGSSLEAWDDCIAECDAPGSIECSQECEEMAQAAFRCRESELIEESLPWIAAVCEIDTRSYEGGVCEDAIESCTD